MVLVKDVGSPGWGGSYRRPLPARSNGEPRSGVAGWEERGGHMGERGGGDDGKGLGRVTGEL